MDEGLSQFLTLVATAGIFSAALTATFNIVGRWWIDRRRARHLALRLAVLFENYAAQCTDAIVSHDNAISSGEQVGDLAVMLPPFPPLPGMDDIWPTLEHDVTSRALSFETEILNFNSATRFEINVVGDLDHDRVVDELHETALRALIVALDLRFRHEVGGIAENRDQSSAVQLMQREREERRRRREEKRAAQKKERGSGGSSRA